MQALAKGAIRKIDNQIEQEIEKKKLLSIKQSEEINNLTQQLKIQKIRNEVFKRQIRFARIITFFVIIFGFIHALSYWQKHSKSINQPVKYDELIPSIIDLEKGKENKTIQQEALAELKR